MSITLTNLRSNIFTDVYAVLNTNVTDPSGRGKQWIFTSIPDVNAPDFVGYPFIVLKKPKINKLFPVFDNSYFDKISAVIIIVYSTANNIIDSLSDSVDAVMIPSNYPQFTFKDYDEDEGDVLISGDNVHTRTMTHIVEIDT